MKLSQAYNVQDWLHKILIEYAEYLGQGNNKFPYIGSPSGDWDSGDKIRSRKLGNTSPKYNAATALKVINKPPVPFDRWMKMENGTRWGEIVYEAISWGCSENVDIAFSAEQRIKEHWSGLSGTIDATIRHIDRLSGIRTIIPIEIKRTDSDKFKKDVPGISWGNWLQTIAEMVLLSEEKDNYGYCEYGFTYCIYSPESNPTHKVWLTRYDKEHEGWHLDKATLKLDAGKDWATEWETESNYSDKIVLSVETFKAIVAEYQEWMDVMKASPSYATRTDKPYETMFQSWHCGRTVIPDYYRSTSKYGNIGDLKDGTGIITPSCPLFAYCYRRELEKAGYTSPQKVYKIQYDDENNLELKPYAR